MAYAGMVSEYNDMLTQQKVASEQAEESGISDNLNRSLDEWSQKATEYSHKFSALAEGGVSELMGFEGLKNAYSSFKKHQEKYDKWKGDAPSAGDKLDPAYDGITSEGKSLSKDVLDRVNTLKNESLGSLGGSKKVVQLENTSIDPTYKAIAEGQKASSDVSLVSDSEGGLRVGSQLTGPPEAAAELGLRPPPAAAAEDEIQPVAAEDVAKVVGGETSDLVEKSIGKTIGSAFEDFGVDEALGSIAGPIGEGIAAVAGVASVAEGLVKLFKHHDKPNIDVGNFGNLNPSTSSALSSKYASSIPTLDSSVELSGSVMSF